MLYMMRHGETDWNAAHRLQGKTDVPLSGRGRKMAEEAGERYQHVHFDICYCSPLIRARETAELFLGDRQIPLVCDDRLKEMGFGICEGTCDYATSEENPISVFFRAPEQYTVPVEGGESIEELFARTGSFLREVAEPALQQGKDLLIVGHGAMNACIACQVRNLPVEKFWSVGLKNCRLINLSDPADRGLKCDRKMP